MLRLPEVRQVLFDRDVVHPRLELRIEELNPLLPNMKNQRATQEQMFETETSSNTSEVEEVSEHRNRVINKTENITTVCIVYEMLVN